MPRYVAVESPLSGIVRDNSEQYPTVAFYRCGVSAKRIGKIQLVVKWRKAFAVYRGAYTRERWLAMPLSQDRELVAV
jgi:hypothetical protein